MNVYEMEGFLRGKCLPGDMKVNESNAQYQVRIFSEMQSQNAELAVQLANAESKCRELAVDNASLKNPENWLLQSDYGYEASEVATQNGATEDESLRAGMIAIINRIGTPATDDFLAEVRAQVWIEGSEPEEFGRYWVRYETDVGPQYCSAKWMEHNFCAGSNTNIHKIWLADHSRSINSLRGVTHYTKLPDSLEGAAQ